jgi:hypothetical protein|tara:strand:- start:34 stop:1353 length:1320 start_codon:yes stop_codon:yes gene_type:complete
MSYKNTSIWPLEANNSSKAKETFFNRVLYDAYAFSEAGEMNFEPWSTKNFWSLENLFYGRIREISGEISIIRPKPEFFLSCKKANAGSPTRALDFVTDAFEHMLIQHKKSRLQGRILEGGEYLGDISAHSGVVDSFQRHEKSMVELNNSFASYCESSKGELTDVFSFDSFVPFFMEFLGHAIPLVPITKSSYMMSKHSSPMTSGLCVEIASLKHSEDADKSKNFLEDENFHIYRHLAANSGFAIDKNAPWRLVADIASKKMLEFAANRVGGISTAEDVLDYYFEDIRGVVDEFEEFKKMTVRFYNTFNLSQPVVSEKSFDSKRNISTKLKRRKRQSYEEIAESFGNDFWYDKFVRVKNLELGLGYKESEIIKIAQNAKDLEHSLDRSRATGYLIKRTTPIVASEGSSVYEAIRSKSVDTNVSTKKEAQALAKSLNKKVY